MQLAFNNVVTARVVYGTCTFVCEWVDEFPLHGKIDNILLLCFGYALLVFMEKRKLYRLFK